MRISDWSSDVCSSDLAGQRLDPADTRRYRAFVHDLEQADVARRGDMRAAAQLQTVDRRVIAAGAPHRDDAHFIARSEEHTSELQSLMRISYAACCLNKKNTHTSPNVFTMSTTERITTHLILEINSCSPATSSHTRS